ncbi:MAG TPA: carbohydrate kinase [Saprospiraceae bacterium]|jgi:fructokinase|nr:carbohydrate kinase [Saprospiraceae bacterium]
MDSSQQYQVVCYGEVLWDILPTGPLPGGAPVNVAYHLKRLGYNPAVITKIGLDNYGKELIAFFSSTGIVTNYFDVDYEHPTGLVYATVNQQNEASYDIVFPSAWDFIQWNEEYMQLLQSSKYFVYGSLTSRNQDSRNTLMHLLEAANTKVFDINLRPPHFRRTNIEYLLAKADILKMNSSELEQVTGWFSNLKTTEDRIQLIQDRFQIETIIITKGADGALVNQQGIIYNHPGFSVTVADTIGSGDSFLAGYLYQLLKGANTSDALDFASGIGAFIATKPGACPDYTISAISEFIESSSTKHTTIFHNQ